MATVFTSKTVRDVVVGRRTALVRVDFNVPLHRRRVVDDTRITAALPTIRYLSEQGARVVLLSHLGRPGGKVVRGMSLKPCVAALEQALGRPVGFCPDAIGPRPRRLIAEMRWGDVLLLENTRFYPEEEANDRAFAAALAALGDVFVNDAFGAAHRAHASTVGVAGFLPAVAGLLLQREVEALSRLLEPERPFVAIIGGSKISDKLGVLKKLVHSVDRLLVGGGMANTFLAARGYPMGQSLVEGDKLSDALALMAEAKERGVELILPEDLVVAESFAEDAASNVVAADRVPPQWRALDIGPKTVDRFSLALQGARAVFWNGPLGVAEWPAFAHGTSGVALSVAVSPAYTVVGGGDSIAAIRKLGFAERIGHISTGGGASLEFLEGKELPGIACLESKA